MNSAHVRSFLVDILGPQILDRPDHVALPGPHRITVDTLNRVLGSLRPLDALVIRMRYGLSGNHFAHVEERRHTYTEIAVRLQRSRSRASQRAAKAKRQLQRGPRRDVLSGKRTIYCATCEQILPLFRSVQEGDAEEEAL